MRTVVSAVLVSLINIAALAGALPMLSNAVTAPTAGTSYITVDEDAFMGLYGEPMGQSGLGGRYLASGSKILVAPVHLPDHAQVTEVAFNVVDNSAGGDVITLFEDRDLTSTSSITNILSSAGTTGASSTIQTVNHSSVSVVIDNTMFSYYLVVTMTATDGSQTLHGVRIGFTTPTGQGVHFLTAPDRYVDTRPGPGNRGGVIGPLTPGQYVDFILTNVAGRDGQIIPPGAKGIIGTVTAVSPTGAGLFKILPGGTNVATGTSTVNFNAGFTTATSFQARLDSSGRVRAYFSGAGQVDLLIDVVGYYY